MTQRDEGVSWQRGSMTLEIECADSGAPAHLTVSTFYLNGRPGIQLRPSAMTVDLGTAQVRQLIGFLRGFLGG